MYWGTLWKNGVFFITISILQFFFYYPTDCYNNEGHEAIGMTAMSGLKNEQLYELKKLLNGRDLVDIGKWGHLVSDKIKKAELMHYNIQKHSCAKIEFSCDDPDGLCLLNSIKHFYSELLQLNGESGNQGSGVPFKYPRNMVFTDADRLKYLVSLVSDMHQPLRLGFLHDMGGKKVNITFTDVSMERKTCSLFDYLEEEIINNMVARYENSWYSGWTHINRILNFHTRDEELFRTIGIEAINIWAEETVSEFCDIFYKNNFISKYLLPDEADNFFLDLTKNPIVLPRDLEYVLERFVRNNILKAGSRISIILNHVFANKKFTSFRKRSELDQIRAENLQSQSNLFSNNYNNALFINLIIIVTVVCIFLYVIMFMNKNKNGSIPTKIQESELQEKYN